MIRPVLASVLLTCVLLGIAYLLFMTTRSLPPSSPMTPNPIVYVEIPVTDLALASKAPSYAIRAAAEESCWRQRLLSAFAQRSVLKPVDYPQRSQTHNQA